MPTAARLDAYVAMVKSGDYVGVMREFYHADARVHENQKAPRVGQEALIANEERAKANTRSIRAVVLEAFQSGADDVAIHSVYEIVEEFFFYDPGQRKAGVIPAAATAATGRDPSS